MAIRALTVLTRRPDVTVDHFEDYWRHRHAAFGAAFPGLTSYTQHHVVGSIARGLEAPAATIDGFSGLTFSSRADFDAAMASEEARRASADAATFIGQMRMYITEDHVVLPGDESATTLRSGCAFTGTTQFTPGESFRRHRHERTTEILVCTAGTVTVDVDGDLRPLSPGEHVVIPRGVPHAVVNDSAAAAEVLYIKTPYHPDDVQWIDNEEAAR